MDYVKFNFTYSFLKDAFSKTKPMMMGEMLHAEMCVGDEAFFVPKIKVALEFNIDKTSPFLWCYYPIRWARQIFIEAPRIFLTRIQKTSKHETLQIERLRTWLQDKEA